MLKRRVLTSCLYLILSINIVACSASQATEISATSESAVVEKTTEQSAEVAEEVLMEKAFIPEKISYAFVEKDDLFGMINSLGEEIIPPVWQSINYLNEGMIAVEYDSGNIEVQDLAGLKLHVFADWERVGPFVNGVGWKFTGDSKLFLIDKEFEVVKELNPLGFGTSMIWSFNAQGLAPHCAVACKGCASGPCGIVNTAGEIVVEYAYQGRELNGNGTWTVWDKESSSGNGDDDKGIVDSTGELILPIMYKNISHCGGDTYEASFLKGDELTKVWIDKSGEEVIDETEFDYVTCIPNKELIMVRKDDKYGFLKPNGDPALDLEYDELFSYQSTNDLIGVDKDGRKYFVDKTGASFDFPFHESMTYPRFGVFEGDWTIVGSKEFSNKDHEIFILDSEMSPKLIGMFRYFEGVSGGVGMVQSEAGKYSIVHRDGSLVELPDYDRVRSFFYP